MPSSEVRLYKQNMEYARTLVATALALKARVTSVINTDDLLRSGLVQGVSAFDHFVHEEIRARMVLTQQGSHPRSRGFERFKVGLISVDLAFSQSGSGWLEAEIREQHGYLSFQQPDKVADAYRLVTDVPVWLAVGRHLKQDPEDVKRRLKLIVDRRNKIAHEADTDPTPPRCRYPIDDAMVTASLEFIDLIVNSLVTVT